MQIQNDIYTLAAKNTVAIVVLNGYELPYDVQIAVNSMKVIASSQILDGGMIYERVTKKPFSISFNFVLRQKTAAPDNNQYLKRQETNPLKDAGLERVKPTKSVGHKTEWYFPLYGIKQVMQNIWKPDSIVNVQSTLLNEGFGITELIIEDIEVNTIPGSVNVPVKIKCSENILTSGQIGNSLIIK
jgi:hypothetical protein